MRRIIRKVRASVSRRDILVFLLGALVLFAGAKLATIFRTPQPLKPSDYNMTITWLPESVTRWQEQIHDMSLRYQIDPDLLAIIITLESGGDPHAKSEAGALGLMQITPPTAADIAKKFLKEPRTDYDLFEPRTNIEFGAAYLAYLRDEFGTPRQGPSWIETVELVAAGYNGGPGTANALEQGEGLRDTQPIIYSRDAFNMWRERHADKSPTYERWLERGGSALVDAAKHAQ